MLLGLLGYSLFGLRTREPTFVFSFFFVSNRDSLQPNSDGLQPEEMAETFLTHVGTVSPAALGQEIQRSVERPVSGEFT